MEKQQTYMDIFNRGRAFENPLFWSRFSVKADFHGANVLYVGCGWGSLCVETAFAGANKVVGLDIDSDLINFATENIENYPQLVKIVEFKDLYLRFYGNVEFDYIVSKDSFEHIIDMPGMLKEMKKRLKPGGGIFSGFGPLYTSAYGDHDRRRTNFRPWGLWGKLLALIPWGHLIMESKIIQMADRRIGEDVNSMYDLGLNKMSVSDFRKVILNSGLVIIEFRVNQSRSIGSRFCSCFKTIPFLKDYFTHNIYCVLEK